MPGQRKGPTSAHVDRLIEKQMRNWEIARAQRADAPAAAGQGVEHFIAVSRAVGLPGFELATALHERLKWPIFDRELLQAMAGDDEYRHRVYKELDQRDVGWLEGFLRAMTQGRFSKEDYFHRMTETIVSLARKSSVVFLGRAADLILPRDVGLRVRITAPLAYRVERYAAEKELSAAEARQQITDIERERKSFFQSHFPVDIDDETRHDLIVNLEQFDLAQTVEFTMAALTARGIHAPE